MEDRELLERAAKAAGMEPFCWNAPVLAYGTSGPKIKEGGIWDYKAGSPLWNPLTDDGDALRLAVKLNLTCRFYFGNSCAQATVPGGPSAYEDVNCPSDPMAGARLAITRAAAELAKEP